MLAAKIRQELKARAHKLKPVIMIGHHGLTEAVTKEIDRALNDHELIKIRVQTSDRVLRRAMFEDIAKQHQAELVQLIGGIGVFFRATEEK